MAELNEEAVKASEGLKLLSYQFIFNALGLISVDP
jgi:hypothetical protein